MCLLLGGLEKTPVCGMTWNKTTSAGTAVHQVTNSLLLSHFFVAIYNKIVPH